MRKYSEPNLVNLANNLIGSTGLKEEPSKLLFESSGEIRNPLSWHSMLHMGPLMILRKKIAKMNNETLANIFTLAINNCAKSELRNTPLKAFLINQTNPCFATLHFGTIPIVIEGGLGLSLMRYIVELTILGTIYDILMTELFIRTFEGGESPTDKFGYRAKPAMIDFVKNHRLNRKPATT